MLKWSLAAAALVMALAFVVPALVWIRSQAVIERRYPLLSMTVAASPEARQRLRGAHLVAIAGCTDCHGLDLEGRPVDTLRLLPLWSSNLRRAAPELSDEELERAIRLGLKPDATSMWAMPAMDYTYMSEDDATAIVSYLRALKMLGASTPPLRFGMPARFAIARGDLEPIAVRVLESPPSLDLGPRYSGGHYLARIACADCHGTDLTGSADAPDLTIVARYSRSDFFRLLKSGFAADGLRPRAMSRPRFRALYDYEIDALYDYLAARAAALGPGSRAR